MTPIESVDSQTPTRTADAALGDGPSSDIELIMKDRYRVGAPVEVRVRNRSDTTTYYYEAWSSCFNLKFFDASTERRPYPRENPGREPVYLLPGQFIVPEGTHCDLISEEDLQPGEEAVLFTWGQEMCIKDIWGCLERVRVGPGEYRVTGEFALDRGSSALRRNGGEGSKVAVAEWKFAIEPQPDWFAVRAADQIPTTVPLAIDSSRFAEFRFNSRQMPRFTYRISIPPNWDTTGPDSEGRVVVSPRYMLEDPIQVVIRERGVPTDHPGFSDGTAYMFNLRITELDGELPDFEVFDVGRLPAGDLDAVLARSRYAHGNGTVDRIDWVLGGPLYAVAYVVFDNDGPIAAPQEKRQLAEAILRSIRVESDGASTPAP